MNLRAETEFEQNAPILSTFYPIGATTTTATYTRRPASGAITITDSPSSDRVTVTVMEPSELTKRLLMNQRSKTEGSSATSSDNNVSGREQDGGAGSPLSAGQASAAATAQQKHHDQHRQHSSAPHPTSAALIQAAAAAAASSVAAATSSSLNDMVEREKQSRRRKDFPWKLHCMLEEADTYNNQHIVSWMPDGRSFRVFLPDEFVARIMPHYFHQTQYRSFQRMLNLYDFTKVVTGPNRGAYSHPMFLRRNRDLCLEMRIRKRNTAKKSKKPAQATDAGESTGAASGSQNGDEEQLAGYAPLPAHHHYQGHQQQQQNFAASSVDIMEGLLPMFQQPLVNTMIQFNQHQHHKNQWQQHQHQLSQFQNQGHFVQQQEQQPDESPLTSRQIHTLDPNFFQGRMLNQLPVTVTASSAPTRTPTNTQPSTGFLPATWKSTVFQRSLLSNESTSDDQRVNLSPHMLTVMDRLVRDRGQVTSYDFGTNQDESKSANSAHHDTNKAKTSTNNGDASGNPQYVRTQSGFQMPLHFDLEPTPLPPQHEND